MIAVPRRSAWRGASAPTGARSGSAWLAASGVGLWFSESRSALGAAGARADRRRRCGPRPAGSARAAGPSRSPSSWSRCSAAQPSARACSKPTPSYRGVGFREQFTATSLRMIARPSPVRRRRGPVLPDVAAVSVAAARPGPTGSRTRTTTSCRSPPSSASWAWRCSSPGSEPRWCEAARALAQAPRDARLLGVSAGVAGFLVTCLTGHPLLIGEVAYPFWLQFGLMTALAGSTLLSAASTAERSPARPRTPRAWSLAAAAAVLAIVISGPMITATNAAGPPASQTVDGFYEWETLKDGTPGPVDGRVRRACSCRPTSPACTFRCVCRSTAGPPGRWASRSGPPACDKGRTMVDDSWAIIDVPLPAAVPPTRFKRIDLKVDRTWQPALYVAGSADLRVVGVQVGELRLVRE